MFEHFGPAVMDSLAVAQTLLRTAGLEATGASTALLAGSAPKATSTGIGKVVDVAARRPELTAVAVAGALRHLWRSGRLTSGWRPLLSGLWGITESVLQVVADAKQEHAGLRGALTVVEVTVSPSVEQSAARRLAGTAGRSPRWSRARRRGSMGDTRTPVPRRP